MPVQWKGVFPAITTKFNANNTLNLPLQNSNIEAQIRAGVDGLILGGTLGESSVLTGEEKEMLLKNVIGYVNRRVPVVLNIAEGSTNAATELAENAERWGADGLMLLPPMRYKTDERETISFFKTVAASTSLPIMIYNNPVDYKTEVTLDMFEALLSCPNIQAIKESTRDVSNVTRLINRFGDHYKILSGVDTIATESMIMGADGWVGGLVCAFPEETVAIYRLVKAGRIAEALAIHRWFLPLLELDLLPKLVQYIKLAETQTGIGNEFVRPPRLTLIDEERNTTLHTIVNCISSRPILPEYLNICVA